MKFVRLRIAGFKSFVDPVEVAIEPGVTGVVGPNGCGKSNLLEALRWVMGAASAKALRAEGMDDVIFAGSGARPARNHAEVALVIENDDRTAPAAFNDSDRLDVSRRIARGAGSSYHVNGREARARDIQLLFADASSGANSPALVRQGQISELVSAKPQNRRRVLEDAAGISGLHARRREAEIRLKAAETNLERVDDVMGEHDKRVRELERQARQARRYKALSNDIQAIERRLHLGRIRAAQAARDQAAAALHVANAEQEARTRASAQAAAVAAESLAALDPAREAEAISAAALARTAAAVERLVGERDRAEGEFKRVQARLKEAADDLAREVELAADAQAALARLTDERAAVAAPEPAEAEAAIRRAEQAAEVAERDRQSAEAAVGEATSVWARADSEAAALAQTIRRAEQRLERLNAAPAPPAIAAPRSDPAPLRARLSQADLDAETARRDAEALAEGLEQADAERRAADATLAAAEAALAAKAGERAGLARLLARPDAGEGVTAADAISVDPGFERALAAALGDDLDAVIDNDDAPARWAGAPRPKLAPPADARPLSEVVAAPPALEARIALIGVVEASEGERLAARLKPGQRLVSIEGDLWRWDGFRRSASAPGAAAQRLEWRNRLDALDAEIDVLTHGRETARAQRDEAAAARTDLAQRAAAASRARIDAERQASESRKGLADLEREHAVFEARREAAAAERSRRALELADAEAALAAERERAREAPDLVALSRAKAEAVQAADAARSTAAQARAAAHAVRRQRDDVEAYAQRLDAETAQWRERQVQSAKRLDALERRRAELEAERDGLAAAPAAIEARRQAADAERLSAERRRRDAADALAVADARRREADAAARAGERTLADAREVRAKAEAGLEAAEARLDEARARAIDALGSFDDAIEAAEAPTDLNALEREVEGLRRQRDGLGAVNLRADEEAETAKAALDTLSAERADLAAAVAKLRAAIGKLNGEARRKLAASFEVIDAGFRDLFQTLFEGGEARLALVDSEDPLEAGLEIHVSPPGKKLGALSLMSGGEQALTAMALIFAVFLVNPSPLCALDEVDAPLDDANVDRFCKLLAEMRKRTETRFLVITHNPVTMSLMDRLYGVTMAERGVSQLVSVDLARAERLATAAA